MHPTDLPAVLFHLEYPLFQGDPIDKRTSLVGHLVVMLRLELGTRECIMSVLRHTLVQKCMDLLGVRRFQVSPASLSFLEAPTRQRSVNQI